MFSAKHNSISYRRVTLLLYFLLMMFYFTHMCDVLIVLCYMYLCINTLLAYAQHCISCATSDNTRHVLCSHFSAEEIHEAKDVLWDKLELSEQKRTNSSKRPASEANVGDIMSALYKLDISADN